MIKPEQEVIWGSVPVPTAGELQSAQRRLAQRMQETAEHRGTEPDGPGLRQHWYEFREASPAFDLWLESMVNRVVANEGDPDARRIYMYGALDVIEMIGAVAANRVFEGILPSIEDADSEPEEA